MKKLLFVFAFFFSLCTAYGQTKPPAPDTLMSGYEQFGQMLNLSTTIAYETLDTATTSSSATTLYLTVCQYSKTTGLPLLYPLIGTGSISFIVKGLKISGTPSGVVLLQGSNNGRDWAQLGSARTIVTADTMTITNVTGAQTYPWALTEKDFLYYRLAIIIPSGTQSTSWSAWYYLNKKFTYGN